MLSGGTRKIEVKDLLSRRSVVSDLSPVHKLVNQRRVVITGAGGSIGSELARQVYALEPQSLTLIDNSEYHLYAIGTALPHTNRLLGDVRDTNRIYEIFKALKPEVVFHAAALKHVPIVQSNPIEGIKTNVFGTQNVVDAAIVAEAETLVMVSTDKAVNPVSVMGATKRVAEMYVRAAGYSVVRFGNVLGSSGSVVPLFEAQIAKGGPITLTDEDVERYFMTIDEAVELVLLAATGQRATYVLDMGEPVNVGALARDMIRLAGKMPDSEIKVELTGLRPGERLQEELFYPKETVKPSGMGGILVADSMIYSNVGAAIGRLEELVRIGLVEESLAVLWRSVRVGS